MDEVTVAVRMSGWKALEGLSRTGEAFRALKQAQYWESFQNAYSTAQVAAGQRLLLAWHRYLAESPVTLRGLDELLSATDEVLDLNDE